MSQTGTLTWGWSIFIVWNNCRFHSCFFFFFFVTQKSTVYWWHFTDNGFAACLPLEAKDLLFSFLSPETGKLLQIYSATSPHVLILHSDYQLRAPLLCMLTPSIWEREWFPFTLLEHQSWWWMFLVFVWHSVKGEYHWNSDALYMLPPHRHTHTPLYSGLMNTL